MAENILNSLGRINDEIARWRASWIHEKPCQDWEEHKRIHGNGYCQHLVNARHKRFGREIDSTLRNI